MSIRFLFIFLILLSSQFLKAETLNYDDLENLIKEQNKKVTAARLDLDASEMRLGYVKRSFIPTAQAFVGGEKFETGPYNVMTEPMYFIRGNLNLYRGGRDALEEKARKAQRKTFHAQAQQVLQGELFEVRNFFWDLVYLREIKLLLENAIKQNQGNLQKAQKRINAGLTTKVDRLEFEISETQLIQDLARIQVEISNTQREISALIGKAPETQYETITHIPHDHADPTAKQTLNFALYRDVQLELANMANLESQGDIFKRWWTPSFDLYAESILFNYRERSFTAQKDQVDNAIGIRLSFDFDGLQQKTDGEALVARARASELRASQIKAETEADFNTAKQELLLLHELIHEGEKNVQKGAEYLDVTLSEYSKGVKNSPDVLSALLKNLEFRRRFAELRRDYAVTKARLQAMLATEI